MTNELSVLTEKIKQWSYDRNLQTGNSVNQFTKLVEEFGELAQGINKNNHDLIVDSIGDMYVVLVVLSTQLEIDTPEKDDGYLLSGIISLTNSVAWVGTSLYDTLDSRETEYAMSSVISKLSYVAEEYDTSLVECVAMAYEEIKDRKGKLINGVFVKESDLKENPEAFLNDKNDKETR